MPLGHHASYFLYRFFNAVVKKYYDDFVGAIQLTRLLPGCRQRMPSFMREAGAEASNRPPAQPRDILFSHAFSFRARAGRAPTEISFDTYRHYSPRASALLHISLKARRLLANFSTHRRRMQASATAAMPHRL